MSEQYNSLLDAVERNFSDGAYVYLRELKASHDALLKASEQIKVWLDNWDVAFQEDDEWPADEREFYAAIAKAESLK